MKFHVLFVFVDYKKKKILGIFNFDFSKVLLDSINCLKPP